MCQNLWVAVFGWMSSCEGSKVQLRLEACSVAALCHRELPWSGRWLPGSQWLFCFHSCYSSKTFAVAAGQQYHLPWSSRGETGGGYPAASICDRWHSDACVAAREFHHYYPCYLQSLSRHHMFSVGANSELEITALVMAEYIRMVVNYPQPNFLTHTKRRASNKGNRCLEAPV